LELHGRIENSISFLSDRAIPSVTYFICGFREDTLATVAANLRYLAKVNTTIGISLFYPVPGIDGFESKKIFDEVSSTLSLGSAAWPWNQSLSTKTMITAFRLSRYINILKQGSRSDEENQLIDLITNKKELFTFVHEKSGKKTMVSVPRQDKDLVKLVLAK